jgi:hypothetical protein
MPITKALNVHCTEATEVPRACAATGMPGRLMSEANRPLALSDTRTASSRPRAGAAWRADG